MKKNIKRIHFLGIGGISQSALAVILKNKGFFVSGSDKVKSETTKRLEELGIPVCIDSVSECLKAADLVVVTGAIKDDDQELIMAKKHFSFLREVVLVHHFR